MKKLSLLLAFGWLSALSFAQVSFTIVEPASIAGGYAFTSNGDGPNWGLANLNDPNDAVIDTVVLADDGTQGINAQGIPFANEACSPLLNDLTGKIAMVYRYDGSSSNVCYVGTKVLNAQNAGAIGVIVVNRDESVYGYNGTTDGPLTNIPFAFISKSDGALIRSKIDAGEDVVAFIGNKLGLYNDDAGIGRKTTLAPKQAAVLTQTSQNGSEFNFDLGTTIYNFGQNDQTNVVVTASVSGPAGTWSETVGPFSIASTDSLDILTGGVNHIPGFSLSSYPDGLYTLDYDLDLGIADESSFDNHLSYNFMVSDSVFTYADIDIAEYMPVPNYYTRSVDPGFKACLVYNDPNGSRVGLKGLHLTATMAWDVTAPLEGESVDVYVYQWNDVFTDLNDPNVGFNELVDIAYGTHEFSANQDSVMVYVPFQEPIILEDNQRYLTCVEVYNDDIWLGYNNRIDYVRNVSHYLQPLFPSSGNAIYYYLGFGEELAPAIALSTFESSELNVNKINEVNAKIYPNPVEDALYISIPDFKSGVLKITDLSGRLVQGEQQIGSISKIDVSGLSQGYYIASIYGNDGSIGQYQFVKN